VTAPTNGPEGHYPYPNARDHELGVFTQTHIPANGTTYPKYAFCGVENALESNRSDPHPSHFDLVRSSHGKLPKINFPVFTGEVLELWCAHCVNYFDMYGVEPSLWVRVVSMHVEGADARWLQSVERCLCTTGWDEFYALVHERFRRDQHESLIHQLFHIRQGGSVAEYVEQFLVLVNQLASYESNPNPQYYVMCFVDRLHDDNKSMVMIQHPSTLVSACALSLMQEKALDTGKKKEVRCYEPFSHRQVHKSTYPLTVPPKLDKPPVSSAAEDKRAIEEARATSSNGKMQAMR
jgi:hypothetical protein